MKCGLKRLKRQAVLESLRKGFQKGSMLLMHCKTQKESDLLTSFLSNASVKMMEFKNDNHATDIEMKGLFGKKEILVRNLKDKAHISTVQDLIVSDLSEFRFALRYGRLPLQEILYAMRPIVIGTQRTRRKKQSQDTSED